MRRTTISVTIFLFLINAFFFAEKNLKEKKSIAQSQHQLIMLLISRGEFGKIPVEFQKILGLNFTGKYERFIVDEVLVLSDALNKKHQEKVSLSLVNMSLGRVKLKANKIRLYKEKGFIYKLLNMPDKALEMFEKVKALEKK